VLLEEAEQPLRCEPLVPAWILASNQHGQLESVEQAELRQLLRGGDG
jgi:hypothetical protein